MRLTGFACASLLSSWNILHSIPFQGPFMIQTADLTEKWILSSDVDHYLSRASRVVYEIWALFVIGFITDWEASWSGAHQHQWSVFSRVIHSITRGVTHACGQRELFSSSTLCAGGHALKTGHRSPSDRDQKADRRICLMWGCRLWFGWLQTLHINNRDTDPCAAASN